MRGEHITNVNLSLDGVGKAGIVTEMTLPKIAEKQDEFRAGGMAGAVSISMGLEKLELEMTLAEHTKKNVSSMGMLSGDNIPMTARANVDTGDGEKPILINMRGRIVEQDRGSWKAGEDAPVKYKAVLVSYKETIDGSEVLEIDMEKLIYKVNGKDKYATMRKNLGI